MMENKLAMMVFNAIVNNASKSNTGRMNAVIPVELIDASPLYQRVEGRNEKKLHKLKNEWDYNLMDALMVVPHPEEYKFYVVDGLGRLTVARQIGLSELDCVIIPGPADPEERLRFEAKHFLRQAICTDPLRPALMHNARVINGDKAAIAVENICREYGVDILLTGGKRSEKKLGSYERTYKVALQGGEDALRWIFDTIKAAGYDHESNGYSGRIITVLGKFHRQYANFSPREIGEYIRFQSPLIFQSKAVAKYPERAHNPEIPMILYLQDYATANGEEKLFDTNGKLIKVA